MKHVYIQEWFRVKLGNIQEYYGENGLWQSLLHFFKRLAEYCGFTFYTKALIFFELDLQHASQRPLDGFDSDLAKVDLKDIECVEDYHDGWFDREQAVQRLREGHVLFAAKDRQNFIFFQWIELFSSKIPSIELPVFPLPEKTACMAYTFTKPEYRKRGIASKAKHRIVNFLREKEYCSIFLVIAPENTISQRVNKKAGFREYQTVTYRKVYFRDSVFFKFYLVKEWNSRRMKIFWGRRIVGQSVIWKTFLKTGCS